jgi:hypothetical protein
MADTRDYERKLNKFNTEHPPKNRSQKTDRAHEPESRTRTADAAAIASLNMINSLHLEQDATLAVKVTKALKAMM